MIAGTVENGQNPYLTGALITETNDHWGRALRLAGAQEDNSVSCARVGYCDAGGYNGEGTAFVISESRGKWGGPVRPAGVPAQYNPDNWPGATVSAVACPPRVALCTAGGSETAVNSSHIQAFIVSQTG